MAHYEMRTLIECKNDEQARLLQKKLDTFYLLNADMMGSLIDFSEKNPSTVKGILGAAARGDEKAAIGAITNLLTSRLWKRK